MNGHSPEVETSQAYSVKLTSTQLDAYLKRIGLDKAQLELTLEGLKLLYSAHGKKIPYENLSLRLPQLMAPISIAMEDIVQKLCRDGRSDSHFSRSLENTQTCKHFFVAKAGRLLKYTCKACFDLAGTS